MNKEIKKEGFVGAEKKKKGKWPFIAIMAVSVVLVLGGCFGVGYVVGNVNGKGSSQESSVPVDTSDPNSGVSLDGSGVSVKCAYVANSGDTYGAYQVDYTVTPVIYTDEIKAELAYSDGTSIDSSILSFDHNTAIMRVTVHCKGVFTKKAELKLYAASDPTVKMVVTFDFKEKLTVTLPTEITVSEGAVPAITPVVTSTGGTITVGKTVTNPTYTWSSEFITWVKGKAQDWLDQEIEDWRANGDTNNPTLGDLVGFADTDCASFFSTAFSANDFLTTKGVKYHYEYEWSDDTSDDPWNDCDGTWALGSAARADFLAEFDGTKPVIDYACTVNNTKYTKSFGLALGGISVTKISTPVTSVTF